MSIRTIEDVLRPLHEEADFVVVGSGAGGATAAWKLTAEGHDVILVEEGAPRDRTDFGKPLFTAMTTMFRDSGMEAFASGRAIISTLQGRVLGGTTVVNAAIAWRMPEHVYERWAADPEIRAAFPYDELHRCWDELDKLMHVTPTDFEIAGRGNTLPAQGAERLGWSGKVINRFVDGCKGAGRCVQGCPNDAKYSTARTLIPDARERGMRVLATCLAQRVDFDDWGKAVGVSGRMRDPVLRRRGPKVTLRARKGVVLAPGCVQLPGLLGAGGYKHPKLGEHFQAHPGSAITPLFEEDVYFWRGATQGWESEQLKDDDVKIEVVNVPPEINASRLPGVGSELAGFVRDLKHAGSWGAVVRMDAQGRIRSRPGWPARGGLTPTTSDMVKLRRGLQGCAEIVFAAGAERVVTGIRGLPSVIGPDQIGLMADASLDPRHYTMYASHMFGTARAAGDRQSGVCDPTLRPWGTKNLWVVDSSVFPRNLGVNPQHSIQAVALLATAGIAAGA